MSYVKYVYSLRDDDYDMENVLIWPTRDIFSGLFFIFGAMGTAANALVLYVFYEFYTTWRFTTKLWINLSLSLLLTGAVCSLRAIGDNVESMSNSAFECSLRMFVPTALDVTCLASLVIMFFDRLTVVHFPNLYIYNEKNNHCKIMYGWLYGLWFFFFKMYVIEQRFNPDRCMTPVSLAFPLETVTLMTFAGAIGFLFITIQGYVFTPDVNTPLQQEWIQDEVEETVNVILLGSGILLLWLPKHVMTLIYITNGWPNFEYQILTMIFYLPARLAPMIPLLVLLHNKDFRRCFWIVLGSNFEERVPVKASITSEQNHADSIFRSVILGMYPNHPELVKTFRYAAHMARQATLSGSTPPPPLPLKKTGTSSVTFDDEDGKKASATTTATTAY